MPSVVGEERKTLGILLVTVQRPQSGEAGSIRPAAHLRKECGRRQVGRVIQQHRRQGRRIDARQLVDQRRHVGLVMWADTVRLIAGQLFIRIERAHHPVDAVGGTGQPEFLAEGVESGERFVLVGVAVEKVRRAEIVIQAIDRLPFARSGDGGQRRTAEPRRVPVDFGRQALIHDVLRGRVVAVGHAVERIIARSRHLQSLAAGQRIEDGRRAADGGLHGRAAVLVPAGEVARHQDFQVVGGLQQQLAAHRVEVLVVVVGFLARSVAGAHVHPAVSLALGGEDAESRVLGQRIVVAAGHTDRAVVADRDFAFGALGIAGAARHHVDDTRGGVLAEHRALRPLQHFDAFELAQVAEADAVARAVHAVDHHAYRRFQADVVAHRAYATDARRGDGFVLRTGHGQAGHQHLQVLDVAHARVLQELFGDRSDRDRHILHGLLTLLRGHRHGGQRGGFLFFGRRSRLLRICVRGCAERAEDGERKCFAPVRCSDHVVPSQGPCSGDDVVRENP